MNTTRIQEKLLAAARRTRVSDRVPEGFDQRLAARLHRAAPADHTAVWALGLWRAVLPALGLVVVSGVLHFASPVSANYEAATETLPGADALESALLENLDPEDLW